MKIPATPLWYHLQSQSFPFDIEFFLLYFLSCHDPIGSIHPADPTASEKMAVAILFHERDVLPWDRNLCWGQWNRLLQKRRQTMKVLRGTLCLCLVLVVWVGLIQAADQKKEAPIAEKKVPVIEVDEATYNFDQVTQGDVVKHDFRVFNRGEAPLEIKSVKPG
jgi:hypothetical protein